MPSAEGALGISHELDRMANLLRIKISNSGAGPNVGGLNFDSKDIGNLDYL